MNFGFDALELFLTRLFDIAAVELMWPLLN